RGSASRARALHHGRQPDQALRFTDEHHERSAPRTTSPGDFARARLQRLRHLSFADRRSYLIFRRRAWRRPGGARGGRGAGRPRGTCPLLRGGWAPSGRASSVAGRRERVPSTPATPSPRPAVTRLRRRAVELSLPIEPAFGRISFVGNSSEVPRG